jgi:hypothetical protein
MGDETVKLLQQQGDTGLILALIFMIGISLVMFKIISSRLEKILDNTSKTLSELVKGFERHTVILERHDDDLKQLKNKRR